MKDTLFNQIRLKIQSEESNIERLFGNNEVIMRFYRQTVDISNDFNKELYDELSKLNTNLIRDLRNDNMPNDETILAKLFHIITEKSADRLAKLKTHNNALIDTIKVLSSNYILSPIINKYSSIIFKRIDSEISPSQLKFAESYANYKNKKYDLSMQAVKIIPSIMIYGEKAKAGLPSEDIEGAKTTISDFIAILAQMASLSLSTIDDGESAKFTSIDLCADIFQWSIEYYGCSQK